MASSQGYRTDTNGTWTTLSNSSYGYDPNFDYLTSENSTTWSYDAAGNRTNSVCDGLNRSLSRGSETYSYTYDLENDPRGNAGGGILGNRLRTLVNGETTATYGWDVLNRMTSLATGSLTTNYAYRADGMRVSKSNTNSSTTYRYDGQMAIKDVGVAAGTHYSCLLLTGVFIVTISVMGSTAEMLMNDYERMHGTPVGKAVTAAMREQFIIAALFADIDYGS